MPEPIAIAPHQRRRREFDQVLVARPHLAAPCIVKLDLDSPDGESAGVPGDDVVVM
jgi:hypothetical protein